MECDIAWNIITPGIIKGVYTFEGPDIRFPISKCRTIAQTITPCKISKNEYRLVLTVKFTAWTYSCYNIAKIAKITIFFDTELTVGNSWMATIYSFISYVGALKLDTLIKVILQFICFSHYNIARFYASFPQELWFLAYEVTVQKRCFCRIISYKSVHSLCLLQYFVHPSDFGHLDAKLHSVHRDTTDYRHELPK